MSFVGWWDEFPVAKRAFHPLCSRITLIEVHCVCLSNTLALSQRADSCGQMYRPVAEVTPARRACGRPIGLRSSGGAPATRCALQPCFLPWSLSCSADLSRLRQGPFLLGSCADSNIRNTLALHCRCGSRPTPSSWRGSRLRWSRCRFSRCLHPCQNPPPHCAPAATHRGNSAPAS